MKVIFLDIDGVLNSEKWFKFTYETVKPSKFLKNREDLDINPIHVRLLQHLLKETGAALVISSSWGMGRTLLDLHELFDLFGVDSDLIIGKTNHKHKERGTNIKHFIEDWNHNHKFKVQKIKTENFIIFDDDSDMGDLKDRLIQTSFKDGLQDEHIEQAIKMLNYKIPDKVFNVDMNETYF